MDNHGLKYLIKSKTPTHEQFIKTRIEFVLEKYYFKMSSESVFRSIVGDISDLIENGIREFRVMLPNDTSYRTTRGEIIYTLNHDNSYDSPGYIQTFQVVY